MFDHDAMQALLRKTKQKQKQTNKLYTDNYCETKRHPGKCRAKKCPMKPLENMCVKAYRELCTAGPDLDLWGPLGRLRCGGPRYHENVYFLWKRCSEASES